MHRLTVRSLILVTTGLAACSGDTDRTMDSPTTTAGAAANSGAPTGGVVSAMGGTGGAPGRTNTGVAGTPAAGGSTANTSGGSGVGGVTGASGSSGAGGVSGASGSGGMGGVSGASGSGGAAGSANTAGNGPTAGTGAPSGQCKAIGWATRKGRTGGNVEVTGGGDAKPIVVTSFDQLKTNAADAQPRVIHVDGTVGAGWSGTSGDRLEVGSNKTIVGLHPGTQLRAAIHVSGSSNVIIRNLVIKGPGSNDDQAWDNLNIEGESKNIWIDHCEFWDGQDGNADVVKGADNVTFTWNIFGYRTGGDHNFSNLVASSDDEPQSEGKLDITLMFNWFSGAAQRQPRCRYGDIHVVNNLFSSDGQKSDYAISAGKNCRVLTEANHFLDIKEPIYTSHKSGTAANELRGDNIFENTSGNTTGYGTAFEPPYEYKQVLVAASAVKAKLEKHVGATLESPGQCDW